MIDPACKFAVASDEALVELISLARSRLVVIASALTIPVAAAAEVPEPGTLILYGLGLAGLELVARRRRH